MTKKTQRWKLASNLGAHQSYRLQGEKGFSAFAYRGGDWAIYGPTKEQGLPEDGGHETNLAAAKIKAARRMAELEKDA